MPKTKTRPSSFKRPVGLVITRRPNELFMIELPESLGRHRIQVACISVDRNQVKIGIDCPREWNVYRGELRGEFLNTPREAEAFSEPTPEPAKAREIIVRKRPRRQRNGQ